MSGYVTPQIKTSDQLLNVIRNGAMSLISFWLAFAIVFLLCVLPLKIQPISFQQHYNVSKFSS